MKWIKVEDEMPDEIGKYLTLWSDMTMDVYDFRLIGDVYPEYLRVEHSQLNFGVFAEVDGEKVTHWMPLPNPPCVHCGAEMVDGKCTVLETDGCYPF